MYITHDQEEAFAMSDRIMVMNSGAIEQLDTPRNLVDHPPAPMWAASCCTTSG